VYSDLPTESLRDYCQLPLQEAARDTLKQFGWED
jgi:hypothetical protein